MMPFFLLLPTLLLAYAWLIYPGLLLLWPVKRRSAPAVEEEALPFVAVLLAAHNEEAVLPQRLENLATQDYPADRLRLYAGDDASDDRTREVVIGWMQKARIGTRLVFADQRGGKMAMLKRLAGVADEDAASGAFPATILILTDANTMFAPDTVRKLARHFCDAGVGGVCGRLVLRHAAGGATDEPHYWELETRLKEKESALDSCLGANGAVYAVRRSLFWREAPNNTIVDDFVLGMKVREQGAQMRFDSTGVAWEELPPALSDEWRRRVRIGAGAFQALRLCGRCLLPRYGLFAWMFWSHKVLRWFTPHLLILSAVVGVLGWAGGGRPSVVWASRVALLPPALCLAALVMGAGRRRPTALRGAFYFVVMQAALFVGFLRFCRGGLAGTWDRTARGAAP